MHNSIFLLQIFLILRQFGLCNLPTIIIRQQADLRETKKDLPGFWAPIGYAIVHPWGCRWWVPLWPMILKAKRPWFSLQPMDHHRIQILQSIRLFHLYSYSWLITVNWAAPDKWEKSSNWKTLIKNSNRTKLRDIGRQAQMTCSTFLFLLEQYPQFLGR